MKTILWRLCLMACLGLGVVVKLAAGETETAPAANGAASVATTIVTNILQLHQLMDRESMMDCTLHLTGVVCAACSGENALVLRDESGAELLHFNWLGNSFKVGDRISLDGTNCAVTHRDTGLGIGRPPLIDNNGVHGMVEKSGTVSLKAGWHLIRLVWFNGKNPFGLVFEYEGPGVPRQPVPSAVLFHREEQPVTGRTRFVNGLNYRCNEGGWWNALPDFDGERAIKTGVVSNFDLSVRSRDQFVALEYNGYLQIPTDGSYTFRLTSDDGSEFFIGAMPYRLQKLGAKTVPAPKPLVIGQSMPIGHDCQWAEMEGRVSFVSEQRGRLKLELKSESGRVQIQVVNPAGLSPTLLLNSRIRFAGVCHSVLNLDGRRIPGTLIVPGWQQVQPLELSPALWSFYPVTPIDGLAQTPTNQMGERIAHVRGELSPVAPGEIQVRDATGIIKLPVTQPEPALAGLSVDVLGLVRGTGSNVMMQSGFYREQGKPFSAEPGSLPVLTTAAQVKELSREEAGRGYPVVIRGTVIGIISGFPSIVIQDASSGIFVMSKTLGRPDPPQIGERWEIDGVTSPGDFAPTVQAQKMKRLGQGRLPEPLRPTWDQLINGSADTQYAEVQGVITGVESNSVVILCRGGKLKVQLPEMPETLLQRYGNTLVRIRGCLLAIWNEQTHQVKAGEIVMANPIISAEVPNAPNLFATTPLKKVSDLLRFDLRANAFQRVKVAGQFTRREGREYYLQDGGTGLRFIPKTVPEIRPGDEVTVVGLPELGGPSPILREALVHKTGHAPLPVPVMLSPGNLSRAGLDATRICIAGTLLNVNSEQAEEVLEVQAGFRVFAALMPAGSPPLRKIPVGSRLALTGVYASQEPSPVLGQGNEAFELLLNSGSDIQVLSRPAWWTIRRALTILGLLAVILLVAIGWITLLHRQVAEKTVQLESQIQKRERLEYQGNLERERTRIARDLHDELGADLTEISMLAQERAEPPAGHLARVTTLIRSLVAKLDEVVWAVDPTMDNTVSLANYLTGFAEEFLDAARVVCRVRISSPIPDWPLPAHVRHQLFLAVKEALNNAVRHGEAREITFQMEWRESILEITLQDQGKGFDTAQSSGGHGLRNLQERLAGIHGRCSVVSTPGQGTTVKFFVPLEPARLKELPPPATPV
jgi:signal transduction histidine kinase